MRDSNLTMEETFHKYLPDTLYQSHYDLAQYYGHTPQEWRKFLRDNSIFIESELAAIAEAEARAALSRLSNASGQEVSALKTLLEKSKLINDAQRQNVKVVLTYVPDAWKEQTETKKITEEPKPITTPEQEPKPSLVPERKVPKPIEQPKPIKKQPEQIEDLDPNDFF
jgi:deoxyribodipyrimidine photolyase